MGKKAIKRRKAAMVAAVWNSSVADRSTFDAVGEIVPPPPPKPIWEDYALKECPETVEQASVDDTEPGGYTPLEDECAPPEHARSEDTALIPETTGGSDDEPSTPEGRTSGSQDKSKAMAYNNGGDGGLFKDASSYMVFCCTSCVRVDVAASHKRNLPGLVISGLKWANAIGLHCCRECGGASGSHQSQNKGRSSRYSCEPESDREQGFGNFSPKFLEGAEVMRFARIVAGAEVPILVDNAGRVAWVDIGVFWEQLQPDEQLVSVEVEQHRAGKRGNLFSTGVRGGLF